MCLNKQPATQFGIFTLRFHIHAIRHHDFCCVCRIDLVHTTDVLGFPFVCVGTPRLAIGIVSSSCEVIGIIKGSFVRMIDTSTESAGH